MTQTLGIIKDNKSRAKIRENIRANGFEIPTPSLLYDIGLKAMLKYSILCADLKKDPDLDAAAEVLNAINK